MRCWIMLSRNQEEDALTGGRILFGRLCRDLRGVTTVEYAVIVGIMALMITASFTGLSGRLTVAMNTLPF